MTLIESGRCYKDVDGRDATARQRFVRWGSGDRQLSEMSGDKIVQRTLAPLPDLSTIVFFRKANRDYVTGRGPFAPEASRGARRFIRWGMWLLIGVGLGVSLVVGAIELYLHHQRANLEASLVTVDAKVVGCDNTATSVPRFVYKAEGKIYEHYPRQTLADMCDNKTWQITYMLGNPDKFAVAPDTPLPEADDDLDAGYLVGGPLLLFLGAFYWMIGWFQARRAGKETRLMAEGGLLPAELIKTKYYPGGGDSNLPSLRIDYRFKAPDGQMVDKRQSLSRFDCTSKTVPPAGSTILILYVDGGLFEAL
jgi:hypothetical protein